MSYVNALVAHHKMNFKQLQEKYPDALRITATGTKVPTPEGVSEKLYGRKTVVLLSFSSSVNKGKARWSMTFSEQACLDNN